MVSHEFRTPLQNISSAIDLLELRYGSEERVLRRIRHAVEQLDLQMRDLAQVIAHEQGRGEAGVVMHKRRFAVSQLATDIADEWEATAARKRLEFRSLVTRDATVVADESRLRQALTNLLSNALKYTETGSVSVELGVSDEDGPRLVGRVSDTGHGIAAADLNRIWEPFVRLAPTDRKASGSGMGLAVVRRVVEAMGGSVSVTSAPGQGSTFEVSVPVELDVSGVSSAKGRRLLLVQDDQGLRELMQEVLCEAGYECDVAANGDEGYQKLCQGHYDAALIDLQMPDRSGMDLAAAVRAREAPVSHLPLIGITGQNPDERDAGAFDVLLAKPASREDIERALLRVGV
jgi:CheY-like chemotaxis protein/two-component sensor histidine kinase